MRKKDPDLLRDNRRLYIWVLTLLGLLIIIIGLCILVFDRAESSSRSAFIVNWLNNALTNVGAGILIVVILVTLARVFHFRGDAKADDLAAGQKWMKIWRNERPSPAQFIKLFEDSKEVQIVGITLNNTFIHSKSFCDILRDRIKLGKTTQFLLLNPDGSELLRREGEGDGRSLSASARNAREQILKGLKMAEVSETARRDHYLTYDFAPTANVLRFGDTLYVVLFMYAEGDFSPALRLTKDGDRFLFDCYTDHFERMWEDIKKKSPPQ